MRENRREDLAAMDSVITESGMEFAAENTFYIEKSELYLGLGEGMLSRIIRGGFFVEKTAYSFNR